MASFVERISVIIDTKADQATSAFKAFRAELTQAQGAAAKFKVAGNAAGNMLGNLGTSIPIIGTYLGGIAKVSMDAADAFSGLAKQSLDLAAATGLSTEEASRWIAVADDFGISADALTTSIGKIAKDLDAPKWAAYGIATRDASGQALSANEILINSLEVLGRVTNKTERARIGQQLFGRQFKELAPLIGKTGDAYRDMLGAVSEGQVITDKEAKKAEEWRLAQDELAESMRDLQLILGELVVEMAPLLTALAKLAEAAGGQFVDAVEKAESATLSLKESALEAKDSLFSFAGVVSEMKPAYEDMTSATHDARLETAALPPEIDAAAAALDQLAAAMDDTRDATDELKDSYDEFMGTIDDEESYQNAMLGLLDLNKTLADIDASVKDGSMTWEEGARRASVAISGTKKDVANYAREVLGVPPERLTNIFALIDQGKLTEAQRLLDLLTRSRTVELLIQATPKGSGGPSTTPPSGGGKGGGNAAEGMTVRGASAPVTINVNVAPGGNLVEAGRQTADALAAFYRNGGPRP